MPRPTKEQQKFRTETMNRILKCKDDEVEFADLFLHHKVHEHNKPFLRTREKWVIYRSGRKVGKSTTTAIKAIHFAWFAPFMLHTVEDRCDIVIVSITQHQSNIMMDMIKTLIKRSPTLQQFIVKDKADELWIKFINSKGYSRIFTRAAGEKGLSIRGYVPHVMIVDEGGFVKRAVFAALVPAGIATDARLWIVGTPFAKIGYYWEACDNARAGTPRLKEQGWHKPDGRYIQFHATSMDNPEVANSPDLLDELKKLTKDIYAQEVLGEFADAGNALIPRDLILNAIGDYTLPRHVRHVMGVDVARTGRDETVFIVLAVDDNDNVYVVESYSEESSTITDVVGKIGEFHRKYIRTMDTIYVDETALGAGVVDLGLSQSLPIRGVQFSIQEKESMYETVVMLFENDRIKLGDHETLVHQLSYLQKEYTPSSHLRIVSEEHDDWPDALALACKSVDSGDAWHMMEGGSAMVEAL